MNFLKKSSGLGAALAASLLLVGCFQERTATGPVVELPAAPAAKKEAWVEYVSENYGTLTANRDVSIYVNPETGDSSVVFSARVDKLAQARGVRGTAVAFRKTTVENMMRQIKSPGDSGKRVAKSAQTRWNASWFDVKAQTEVHEIKVYFEASGSYKMKPNWIAAAREAMTKWNAVPNTQVSFVETSSSTDFDVRLQCAVTGSDAVRAWMTPDPWVEKDSVDIYLNPWYENATPHNQKVAFVMIGFGNILNITHTGNEGNTWESGTFLHIPGTPYSDPASVFQLSVDPATPATFSPDDMRAIQQMYPSWGSLAKNTSNQLISSGWEGPVVIANNVNTFEFEGDTLYFLKTDGSFYRRVGPTGSNMQLWPNLLTGNSGALGAFAVSQGYVVVQKLSDGSLYTRKPGASTWLQHSQVAGGTYPQFRIGGQRLEVYYPNLKKIYGRYLSTSPTVWNYDWDGTASNVLDFQVLGDRLIVVDNGNVYGMDGYTGWTYLWDSGISGYARKTAIAGDQIVVIYDWYAGIYGASLKIGMHGGWQFYASPLTLKSLDVCGDKFAVVNHDYTMYVRDGATNTFYGHSPISNEWHSQDVTLSGPMCDHVTRIGYYGQLWAKYSVSTSPGYLSYGYGFGTLAQRQ